MDGDAHLVVATMYAVVGPLRKKRAEEQMERTRRERTAVRE